MGDEEKGGSLLESNAKPPVGPFLIIFCVLVIIAAGVMMIPVAH